MFRVVLAVFAVLVLAGTFGVATSRGDFSTDGVYAWPGALFVHVDNSPAGGGYVRSEPYLLDCPSICTRPVAAGTVLKLSAAPSNNYVFLGWDDAGPCAKQINPCTFTATAAKTEVTALYKFDPPPPAKNEDDNNHGEQEGCQRSRGC